MSENEGFGRGRGGQDNEDARDVRKNIKVFENFLGFNPIYAKHVIFGTGLTYERVAK